MQLHNTHTHVDKIVNPNTQNVNWETLSTKHNCQSNVHRQTRTNLSIQLPFNPITWGTHRLTGTNVNPINWNAHRQTHKCQSNYLKHRQTDKDTTLAKFTCTIKVSLLLKTTLLWLWNVEQQWRCCSFTLICV
jgi:hypothetical protein